MFLASLQLGSPERDDGRGLVASSSIGTVPWDLSVAGWGWAWAEVMSGHGWSPPLLAVGLSASPLTHTLHTHTPLLLRSHTPLPLIMTELCVLHGEEEVGGGSCQGEGGESPVPGWACT